MRRVIAVATLLAAAFFGYVESRTATNLGVTLHAVQTVLFNPPGVESAVRPAMYATLHQTVTLRKTSDGWKITSFENQFDRMDSLTAR